MLVPTIRGSLIAAFVALAVSLSGCGSSAPGGEGGTSAVDSAPVGGLVAVAVPQSSFARGFRFVNPASGKMGPVLPLHVTNDVPSVAHRGPIAFSPDGVHVVFATTEDNLPVWTYGRLELDADGAPVYVEERRFAPAIGSEVVHFNAAGDRFYTARGWYDPESGRSHECPPVVGSTEAAVVASPDGRHHLFGCDEVVWLYFDHERLGPSDVAGLRSQFSQDGQTLIADGERVFDVPDRASRIYGHVGFFGRLLDPGDPLREALIDAHNRIAIYGLHGFGEALQNGCRDVSVEFVADPLVTEYDLLRWVKGDATSPSAELGRFDRSLVELRDRYDGGLFLPYGRSADGRKLLMGGAFWRLELVRVDDGCLTMIDYASRVVRVDLEDDTHEVVSSGELGPSELIGLDEPQRSRHLDRSWPFGMVPEPSAVELAPGLTVLPTRSGGFWGLFDDGSPALFPSAGTLPSPDGRVIVGASKEGQGDGPLCVTRTVKGAARRCIEALAVGEPWAMGGHNVVGVERLSEAATVVHLQPSAAFDGMEVHVWGHGFGAEPGRLMVGEREVSAADRVSWSDTHVVFRMSEAVGSGRVLIEGPQGVGRDARPFVVLRTPREPTPWSDTELGPVVWQQGVQRYPVERAEMTTLAGAAGEFAAADAEGYWLYRRAPVDEVEERFVEAMRDSWIRQYAERRVPGLAATLDGWQVVGGGDERGGFDHYEQAGPLLLEVGHGSTLRRDEHGAYLERNVAELGAALPASRWGMPSHPFVLEDGSILAVHPPVTPSFVRIVDFRRSGATDVPQYDESMTRALPLGMAHVAALGEVVMIVGRAETSLTTAAWMMSTDGGVGFGAAQSDAEAGRLGPLAPITAGAREGFIVLEYDRFGAVSGAGHLGLDGVPSWDVWPAPPGTAEHLRLYGDGARVFAYAPDTPTLSWLDTSVDGAVWQPIFPPSGELLSAFWDRAGERLVLATADDVFVAPWSQAPTVFEALARPELPFASVVIRGVGVLGDGTLVLRNRLEVTGEDGGPHEIQGLLVRPPAGP